MKIKSIKFTNHPVLKNLDFNFEVDGAVKDITLLVGENGCGKTILLEELYKIINGGITIWNDGIGRRLTILFSDEEVTTLSLPSTTIVFDYIEVGDVNWNRFKIYDVLDNDITINLLNKLQDRTINNQLKCAYSTVEINFTSKKIDSVKATSIDSDEKPKSKSNENIATEIAQLLVDIKAQDDAEGARWMRQNKDKTLKVPIIEGKLDRFKRAYHNMFEGKQLCDIRPEDGIQKILFKNLVDDSEFEIEQLSSGEKQIVYRVGYLLRNLKKISDGIVLIDEPELSLHPIWQIKFIDFLRELFSKDGKMSVQFIIATHSPYLLKSAPLKEVGVAVFLKNDGNIEIQRPNDTAWSLFKNGPTIGEISYYAFNLSTIEFHNELYGHIQEKELKFTEKAIEKFFISKSLSKSKNWIKLNQADSPLSPFGVTLMTYIRNTIHHPENTSNINFTDQELENSIKKMIPLAR